MKEIFSGSFIDFINKWIKKIRILRIFEFKTVLGQNSVSDEHALLIIRT